MIALVTGMSATGKSAAVAGLRAAGVEAVDCDTDLRDGRPLVVQVPDGSTAGGSEWMLDPVAFAALLAEPRSAPLFVSACCRNQQDFRDSFDVVVLLTAPAPVILGRLVDRTSNPYGKHPRERDEVVANLAAVEPLLRRTADVVIDTSRVGPAEVVAHLLALVGR